MAIFATKAVLLCFILFMVFSVRTQGTGNQVKKAKKVLVSSYMMKLYKIWTNQSNQTKNKGIPFNATAVRAMYFAPIQNTSSNPITLTVDMGQKRRIRVLRDELHLYIIKPAAPSHAQTFTIKITDSLTNKLMASQTITLQTSGWYAIYLHRKLQYWFNNGQAKRSLSVEFRFGNAISNKNQVYPRIETSLLEQPYLIIFVG